MPRQWISLSDLAPARNVPASVSVTISEGSFVLLDQRQDGSANWKFLRKTQRGMKPGRVPRRYERLLQKGHP